jgi:YgiT-type zinc finger domain-containing protein
MFTCAVCQGEESLEELVDEVFRVGEEYVLVGRIPAEVCVLCGEQAFSSETTERVRSIVHGRSKSVQMQIFDFTR